MGIKQVIGAGIQQIKRISILVSTKSDRAEADLNTKKRRLNQQPLGRQDKGKERLAGQRSLFETLDTSSEEIRLPGRESSAYRTRSGNPARLALAYLAAGVVIIIFLILVWGLGHKDNGFTTLSDDKIKDIGEVIEKSANYQEEDWGIPFSREDSIKAMQEAAEEMKKRSEEIQGKKIVVADKETLTSSLPKINGWQLESSEYHKGAYGVDETSNLSVRYGGPDSRQVHVEIIDYGAAAAALQPLKMIFSMNNSTENHRRYARVSSYNDILVFEEYDKKAKQAEFSFIKMDRYLINLKCKGNDSLEILKEFLTGFDLSKLE